MNQPPFQPPPGGFGPPPGGYGGPPGGSGGLPPGGFGGPPGGGWGPAGDPGWGASGYGPPPAHFHGGGPRRTSGTAIAALVTGIAGCVCCAFPITSIVAIVCGFIARSEIQKDASVDGNGMAMAGIVLGFLAFAIFGALLMLGVVSSALERL
jgi:hypothetical protein